MTNTPNSPSGERRTQQGQKPDGVYPRSSILHGSIQSAMAAARGGWALAWRWAFGPGRLFLALATESTNPSDRANRYPSRSGRASPDGGVKMSEAPVAQLFGIEADSSRSEAVAPDGPDLKGFSLKAAVGGSFAVGRAGKAGPNPQAACRARGCCSVARAGRIAAVVSPEAAIDLTPNWQVSRPPRPHHQLV